MVRGRFAGERAGAMVAEAEGGMTGDVGRCNPGATAIPAAGGDLPVGAQPPGLRQTLTRTSFHPTIRSWSKGR